MATQNSPSCNDPTLPPQCHFAHCPKTFNPATIPITRTKISLHLYSNPLRQPMLRHTLKTPLIFPQKNKKTKNESKIPNFHACSAPNFALFDYQNESDSRLTSQKRTIRIVIQSEYSVSIKPLPSLPLPPRRGKIEMGVILHHQGNGRPEHQPPPACQSQPSRSDRSP